MDKRLDDRENRKPKKDQAKPPPKSAHPLQKGIKDFITTHLPPSQLSEYGLSLDTLTATLPKRYTIYPPLLLLPANALSISPAWGALYTALNDHQRQALYACIVDAFQRYGVTHVAINAPIASTHPGGQENRVRSPAGLVPLHGDFGPSPSAQDNADREEENVEGQPSETDLQQALWVSTVQNHGIVQIWAPLYTMFSRGNVTEKARILGYGNVFEGLDEASLQGENVEDVAVVDMYAGIGYFVFSYLKRGVKRVWGWEINGWSIEGLRRGCAENGWGCKVVRVHDDGTMDESISRLASGLDDTVRVVIFHGDNRFAAGILDELRNLMQPQKIWNSIRHVNLGLLPSSRAAWDNATRIVDINQGGWVHVHENVDIREIDQKRDEISAEIGLLWDQNSLVLGPMEGLTVECRHVERVKTYAPGVMHCVFDIHLPAREGGGGSQ